MKSPKKKRKNEKERKKKNHQAYLQFMNIESIDVNHLVWRERTISNDQFDFPEIEIAVRVAPVDTLYIRMLIDCATIFRYPSNATKGR